MRNKGSSDEWVTFPVAPLQILGAGMANAVAGANALKGQTSDSHLTEDEVQSQFVRILLPHLPSPELITERKKLTLHQSEKFDRELPDVTIWNIDRKSYWGIFEIKTLLDTDNLTVKEVMDDLDKLFKYKKKHPNAACVFALIGGQAQLFSTGRSDFRTALPIKYLERLFDTPRRRPQKVKDYFATPCGYSGNHKEVKFFAWEIQITNLDELISKFDFEARAIGNAI